MNESKRKQLKESLEWIELAVIARNTEGLDQSLKDKADKILKEHIEKIKAL